MHIYIYIYSCSHVILPKWPNNIQVSVVLLSLSRNDIYITMLVYNNSCAMYLITFKGLLYLSSGIVCINTSPMMLPFYPHSPNSINHGILCFNDIHHSHHIPLDTQYIYIGR